MEYAWGIAASKLPFPGDFVKKKAPPSIPPSPLSKTTDAATITYACDCHSCHPGGHELEDGSYHTCGGIVPRRARPAEGTAEIRNDSTATTTGNGTPLSPDSRPPGSSFLALNLQHMESLSTVATSSSPLSSTSVCSASKQSLPEPADPLPLSAHPSSGGRQTCDRLNNQRYQHPQLNLSSTIPSALIPQSGASTPRTDNRSNRNRLVRNRPSAPLFSPAVTTTTASDQNLTRNLSHHHATMVGSESTLESATTSLSGRTVTSTGMSNSELLSRDGETSSTKSQTRLRKPFVTKSNGRTYLADPTLAYPLPVDLQELHRQSLRTLLLFQLFGGPVCSPALVNRPPTRVLDIACGYGFWSMMCHSYFSRKGYSNIHFTGVDIAPIGGIAGMPNVGGFAAPARDRGSVSAASGNWAEQPPDKNMQWTFVQHDMRNVPLPFPDGEFDLIMVKDLSLVIQTTQFQGLIDEYMRLLKPGGVIEVWDCDHPIRMLRPHVPDTPTAGTAPKSLDEQLSASDTHTSTTANKKGDQEREIAELGAYLMGNNTPLSGPQNNYLIEYNGWILKYLESRLLLNFPCANVGPHLIQEPLLTGHGSKRLAIPLAEVRWEREGVGGVVTKDGKSYINTGKAIGRATTKPASDSGDPDKKGRVLSTAQLALRETALQTVLGFIEGMEPALREVSGKKQDEWDAWMGKLIKELVEKDGANCGECLEVGAWWARKVQNPP